MAKMAGARFLAQSLEGFGLTHSFMVPAVLRQALAEIEGLTGIHRIHTHGENSAAYMADCYSRVSGRLGVS